MKTIKGYEGIYSVTQDGRIWSHPRSWVRTNGSPSHTKGSWLKNSLAKNGYKVVSLYKDFKPDKRYVHRLVAEAFLPRLEVNHKNGIKTDNRLENLEWMTTSQNVLHAKQVLKVYAPKGEKSPQAKLTENDVREIKKLKKEGKTMQELATQFGVCTSGISRIVNRQLWSHVD